MYLNNELHRLDGPSWIGYYENGQIYFETWYLNNKLHRLDGPAYIEYYENGQICHEQW